jgi:hypothetical protein
MGERPGLRRLGIQELTQIPIRKAEAKVTLLLKLFVCHLYFFHPTLGCPSKKY